MRLLYKNIKTFAFLCMGVGMSILASCEEKQEVFTGFDISAEAFHFSAEGGSADFQISSDNEWTVESSAEWCMVTPANGIGSMDCQVLVDTSYLYKEREAVLTFYSGSQYKQIPVSQFGYEKVIRTEEESYDIPYYSEVEKSFIEVTVVTNVDFEVILPEGLSWLKVEKQNQGSSSVPRPQKLKIGYDINTAMSARIAEIELKPVQSDGDQVASCLFEVKQASSPEIQPSRAGDSLAVVMIARMLKTHDPSTSGLPMSNWESVRTEEFPVENGAEGEVEVRVTGLTFQIFDTNESLPFFIKYLTKLKSFNLMGNANGYIKSIALTDEITSLKHLEYLKLVGYGISSLPEGMKNMKSLIALDLGANTFQRIPLDIISELPNLRYLSLTGNRKGPEISDLSEKNRQDIGLQGTLSADFFKKMNQLEHLALSYNYLEGTLPELPEGSMPNLRYLGLNLNFFTGALPQWILNHPYLGCWSPDLKVFNQHTGKDSAGKKPGFSNVPNRIPECPQSN